MCAACVPRIAYARCWEEAEPEHVVQCSPQQIVRFAFDRVSIEV
jgi:hypothetical protein